MSLQFDRQGNLEIFNDSEILLVEKLRIRFTVIKTLLGYPNKGRIEIFNLAESKIQRITQRDSVVRLFGGYAGQTALLFEANVVNYFKTRLSADSIFTLITGSSNTAWEKSAFTKTFEAGIAVDGIITEVANSFSGVTVGTIEINPEWKTKLSPLTLSGSSAQIMNTLSRDYNFDWAIEQNQLNVIPRGFVLVDKPIFVVNPQTGLIGAPTLTELGADFRILINPEILPGRRVQMNSNTVQLGQAGLEFRKVRTVADGIYKVMETRLIGDTRGQDWYTDIIGWRVGDEPRKDVN